MILTAEITMYPFKEDFIPPIQGIIEKLNRYPDLKLHTFPTATILVGEHDHVMNSISDAMRWSHETYGRAAFVVKFIPDYEPL